MCAVHTPSRPARSEQVANCLDEIKIPSSPAPRQPRNSASFIVVVVISLNKPTVSNSQNGASSGAARALSAALALCLVFNGTTTTTTATTATSTRPLDSGLLALNATRYSLT